MDIGVNINVAINIGQPQGSVGQLGHPGQHAAGLGTMGPMLPGPIAAAVTLHERDAVSLATGSNASPAEVTTPGSPRPTGDSSGSAGGPRRMRKKRSTRSLATQARDREQALARKLRWNGTSWTSEVAEAPSRSAELQAQQDRQRKLQDSLASANKNCLLVSNWNAKHV